MRPDKIKDEIEKLELSEKLLLVEDVWDSIAASNVDIPLSEWQKGELDQRYKAYKDGNLDLQDWKTTHSELREKFK